MEYLEESLSDWLGEELQVINAYPGLLKSMDVTKTRACLDRSDKCYFPLYCCTSRSQGTLREACHLLRIAVIKDALLMQAYGEDDYLIFDCPGQIELYSHVTVFRSFVDYLKRDGWNLAAVYTVDCQFVGDPTKFIAGSLQAMSAMVQLELPHVNILTKVDLLGEENKVHQDPPRQMAHHLTCLISATAPQLSSFDSALEGPEALGLREASQMAGMTADKLAHMALIALGSPALPAGRFPVGT